MRTFFAFASAAALGLLSACPRGARVRAVEEPPEDEVWLPPEASGAAAQVREEELPQSVHAAGKVAFDDMRVSHVFTPVTGRVTQVLAQPGQKVTKGAALAVIASPDVGNAFSDLLKAQADLVSGEREFERQRKLAAARAGVQRDLEMAEDNFHKAKAEFERARQKAALLRGGAGGEVSQQYVLRSPIDGEVIARAVNPGIEVQGLYSAGSAVELFTVGDIKSVWVFADVAELDLPRVALGAPVQVRVLAYPGRAFDGKVDYLSSTLDPAMRTARIRCALPNEGEELKPEMYAQLAVRSAPQRALALPRAAVARINGQDFAYVDAGTRPDGRRVGKRRRIRVAEDEPGDVVALVDGLQAGERVLIEPAAAHKAGGDLVSLTDRQFAAARIKLAVAQVRAVPDAVSIGGRLAFDDLRISHVFASVTGRVTRVLAQPGERVAQGAPLLTILSPDMASAFSDAMKAQADLRATEHEYQRQKELYEAHAGALKDLEAAEASFRKAKAEYERAALKRQLLQAGGLDEVTQEYTLRSPIAGEVVARNVNPGMEVQGQYSGAGNPLELFTIGESDVLWVLGDVYEIDLPRVREGDGVAVRVSAYPDKVFHGKVEWVSDVLDPVLRTAKVRCSLVNAERLLKPEMYEPVTIEVPAAKTLALPRRAILRLGPQTIAFVLAGVDAEGRTNFRRVAVRADEERPGGLVPVLEGIREGDTVVVEGSVFLVGLL